MAAVPVDFPWCIAEKRANILLASSLLPNFSSNSFKNAASLGSLTAGGSGTEVERHSERISSIGKVACARTDGCAASLLDESLGGGLVMGFSFLAVASGAFFMSVLQGFHEN